MTRTDLTRVDLPSGGWWDILCRPTWRHVQGWRADDDRSSEAGLVDRALVSLTIAWSFREPVTVQALACRDAADVFAAMECFEHAVLPALGGGTAAPMQRRCSPAWWQAEYRTISRRPTSWR